MSGQLNNVDQMIYGSSNGPTNSSSKQGLIASIGLSENFAQQQPAGSKYAPDEDADGGNGTRRFPASSNLLQQQQQQPHFMPSIQYGAHPTLVNHLLTSDGANYSLTGANQSLASNSSMGLKLTDVHGMNSNELMNLKGNSRLNYINTAQQQLKSVDSSSGDLQHSMLPNLSSKQLSYHLANQSTNNQQSPDISINNQLKSMLSMQSSAIVNSRHHIAANEQAKQSAIQKQQMLNLSLARNQPLPQQQPNQFFSSIYRPYAPDNNNTNNNINNNTNSNGTSNATGNSGTLHDYGGGPLRHQQNVAGVDSYPGGILARATNQGIPLNPIKYNIITAGGSQQHHGQRGPAQVDSSGHSINYDTTPGSQFSANVSNDPQHASTLSNPMHQSSYKNPQQRPQNLQAIYEFYPHGGQPLNANHLSSSITCCNLTGSCPNETPLLDDLLVTSNRHQQHQQQQRLHYPQNARIYELRSATLDPRRFNPAMPRSISAHQLSKLHTQQPLAPKLKQAKPQQQQLLFQPLPQQAHQLPYKSISDAGKAATRHHQPPDHSLSYPHACTGVHDDTINQLREESPALPPPPPPPNLVHQAARPEVVAGKVVSSANFSQIDNRRAAFKVSRLDSSQLTNDNLQDREMVMNNLLLGSMQFDDQSTESDGTFGMMISQPPTVAGKPPILNVATPMNYPIADNHQTVWRQQQGPFTLNPRPMNNFPRKQIQTAVNHHLGDCNAILKLRQQQLGQAIDQNLICNCGAIERVNQIYQRHLTSSSREYDDSDDGACLAQQRAEVGAFEATMVNHHAQFSPDPSHSSVNPKKQRRITCFKQRSSEITADEEEDEEEFDVYQVDRDDDESSDVDLYQVNAGDGAVAMEYRARSVVRNEELLRDEPLKHFSGSHTSISCHSCACGSQVRLNRLNIDEDMEQQQQQAQLTSVSSMQDRQAPSSRAGKNEIPFSENQQASDYHGSSKNNNSQQAGTRTPKKTSESLDSKQSSKFTGSKENCDTTKATVGNKMN